MYHQPLLIWYFLIPLPPHSRRIELFYAYETPPSPRRVLAVVGVGRGDDHGDDRDHPLTFVRAPGLIKSAPQYWHSRPDVLAFLASLGATHAVDDKNRDDGEWGNGRGNAAAPAPAAAADPAPAAAANAAAFLAASAAAPAGPTRPPPTTVDLDEPESVREIDDDDDVQIDDEDDPDPYDRNDPTPELGGAPGLPRYDLRECRDLPWSDGRSQPRHLPLIPANIGPFCRWSSFRGKYEDGRNFWRFTVYPRPDSNHGARVAVVGEDGPKKNRVYAYHAEPAFGGRRFENQLAVDAWLRALCRLPPLQETSPPLPPTVGEVNVAWGRGVRSDMAWMGGGECNVRGIARGGGGEGRSKEGDLTYRSGVVGGGGGGGGGGARERDMRRQGSYHHHYHEEKYTDDDEHDEGYDDGDELEMRDELTTYHERGRRRITAARVVVGAREDAMISSPASRHHVHGLAALCEAMDMEEGPDSRRPSDHHRPHHTRWPIVDHHHQPQPRSQRPHDPARTTTTTKTTTTLRPAPAPAPAPALWQHLPLFTVPLRPTTTTTATTTALTTATPSRAPIPIREPAPLPGWWGQPFGVSAPGDGDGLVEGPVGGLLGGLFGPPRRTSRGGRTRPRRGSGSRLGLESGLPSGHVEMMMDDSVGEGEGDGEEGIRDGGPGGGG